MRKAIEEAKKFVCTTKDRIVKDAKEFIQNVDWKKVASGAFMLGAIGGAVGGGTTEVLKDVGSNVLGKVSVKSWLKTALIWRLILHRRLPKTVD